MNFVDLIVIGAVIVFAWSGWRHGFVSALLSFIGFIGGGIVGSFVAPWLLSNFEVSGTVGLILTIGLVIGFAIVGQVLTSGFGRYLRDRITWEPARLVDNFGGAALNVLAIAIVAWVLAATAAALPASSVSASVRSSTLLTTLDGVVPNQARDFVGNLRILVDDSGLPQLFDSFGVLPPAPVDAPETAVVRNPAIQSSLRSVVKVQGSAPSCSSGFTGSGFVVARNRVLTNAHVVAGVEEPTVSVPRQGRLRATTVYFDPRIDVAILDVPGLDAPTLDMSGSMKRGADGVIAGYPGGGPMKASAARVRGTIPGDIARGTDIYGKSGVSREIYALRGTARPGNSGGPFLAADGDVAGVIFAQAQGDEQTAYALTANQVEPAIAAGRQATQAVSTGRCAK
ncbi:MAG: MarP family serine protease [Actinobacteria bacterium]|nr:MarP family serine protease [Actinomycetota bacterium]